jgi:hypothetical protein
VIDNDSSDGSQEYLAGEPDVHLFRTSNRFSEAKGGIAWLNALLSQFGVGCWCVTVDIDELLIYPGSEQMPLHALTQYLDKHRCEALSCMVLDLYPEGPLSECRYEIGGDLIAAAPLFDAGPYRRFACELCPGVHIAGGMRERIFYPELRSRGARGLFNRFILRAQPRRILPCLTKVPLVKWDEHTRYLSNHWITAKAVAPETGVLLHFKFLQDFHARAMQEAARGEYYDGAAEYRRYAKRLRQNRDFSLTHEASRRFEGTTQLVQLGLMRTSEAWTSWKATG